MPLHPERIRALTLDLDDTLWAVGPVIARAETALHDWLAVHAPRVQQRFDAAGLKSVRESVTRECPQWAHDLTAQRLETIRRVLSLAGEDEALAAPAFEVFFAERHRVQLFDDVPAALQRLADRWPLLAVSNGNADVHRVGLSAWFCGSVSARDVGVAKPDRRIFEAACERLGCAPAEVLHVGDDEWLDVRAARAAGLQAAWVRRGADVTGIDLAWFPGGECGASAWQGPDLLALANDLGV